MVNMKKDEVAKMMTDFTISTAIQGAMYANLPDEEIEKFKENMQSTYDNVLMLNKKMVQLLINKDLMKNVE